MKNSLQPYFLIAGLAVASSSLQAAPEEHELTTSNYSKWIEYIRPSPEEEKWRVVAWRNKLMTAVKEARQLQRPVLLWAMNGNPCGET